MALICDTGVLYASADRRDPDHAACAGLLRDVGEPLVVPAPVLVELEWLLTSRMGSEPFDEFLGDVIEMRVLVQALDSEDYVRIRSLCKRYDDLPLGFVDASVIAVAERMDETRVASLDRRHFTVVRPRHTRSLTLLPD